MKYVFASIAIALLWGCKSKTEASVPYDMILSNINVIDGTGKSMQVGVSVAITNGKIVAIDSEFSSEALTYIDGTGKYLIPGLFDCHTHTMDYNRDFPRFMHYGVTSIFITGGSLCTDAYYSEMRERGEQDSIPAPRVYHTSQHFTMEGRHPSKTYASSNWRDGESIFYLKDTVQIEKLVQRVSKNPIVGIKLTIEDGPAPPFVERMPQEFINKTVKEADKYSMEVFAHVSDNTELEMAINAGVQNLIHYTGVNIDPTNENQVELLKEFIQRDPSWVTTLMIDKSFLYPLHPEWFENDAMLPEYQEKVNAITPDLMKRSNMHAMGLREEYGMEGANLSQGIIPQVQDIQYLYGKGFNMVLGTDTGNDFNFPGYSLHEEMQLMEMGGIPKLDIIKMGTLNAAKMMGVEDHLGSIEIGKVADMVILDKNPLESIHNTLSINTVLKNGVIQKRINN
ncbi:amidohydrolase family protein [Muricauda sp. CAU 1633]|uniref:amidohydrolase family protein n=1 Tax=Allomuricauda sp. CAU 1633 TaxID=2816036 RepID=UPI001A8C0B14|nr:amidohydrolase family protein [Muricauda sp. CAU 1633]MBO0323364.1 amidohydrolase family protein [Muricauda sp. CAU 1633]